MEIKIKEIEASETWDLRHTVMWPNMPFDYVKLEEDKHGMHLGLFKDKDLVTVVSLFFKGNEVQFRKLATKVSEQGQGYGTQILEHIVLLCKERAIEKLWCNARVNKTAYYQKFGLIETEKRYTKGGIDFVILEKLF